MIAVLADTHLGRGSRVLPPRCVELLGQASLIVHAGDFTTLAALRALEALGPPVAAVHGNVDEPALRALLPERTTAEAEGMRIGVVHDAGPGRGRHERLLAAFPGCALVVYGHTHLPELTRAGDVWIVNPGSPTERRRAPARTIALVRDGAPELVELEA